jgi:Arc/MetJ-type ribon-helix-helix transcriptional regulator
MERPIKVIPKMRGRPATGNNPLVATRMPPEFIRSIDKWAASNATRSRSAAIRQLIELGLTLDKRIALKKSSEAILDKLVINKLNRSKGPAANASVPAAVTAAQTIAGGFSPSWLPAAQDKSVTRDKLVPKDLRTPISGIPIETLRYLAKDEDDLQRRAQEEDEQARAAQVRKLVALFHYLNDNEAPRMTTWPEFALRLAIKAYPGLRVETGAPKKQGAPRKWKGAHGTQLVAEVTAIMESQRKNADHALRALLEFKGVKKRDFTKQFKALKRRYYEALKYRA